MENFAYSEDPFLVRTFGLKIQVKIRKISAQGCYMAEYSAL